jgi:hypothetical protein
VASFNRSIGIDRGFLKTLRAICTSPLPGKHVKCYEQKAYHNQDSYLWSQHYCLRIVPDGNKAALSVGGEFV